MNPSNYYPNQKFDQNVATGVPAAAGNFQMLNQQHHLTERLWSSGLCDCCSDCSTCCLTFWCPCITFGRIAEIVDKGSSSCGVDGALYCVINWLTGCACLYSCFYRSKMRQQYMLPDSPCGDCLVHFCCETCALCQEYRELKARGFDMSLGWHGNLERQNRGKATAPMMEVGMTR